MTYFTVWQNIDGMSAYGPIVLQYLMCLPTGFGQEILCRCCSFLIEGAKKGHDTCLRTLRAREAEPTDALVLFIPWRVAAERRAGLSPTAPPIPFWCDRVVAGAALERATGSASPTP